MSFQVARRFSRTAFVACFVACFGATGRAQAKKAAIRTVEDAVALQTSRIADLHLDAFIDSLDIPPGGTVLDLGAGPGLVSCLFAEKLRSGNGQVFATDIRKDFVDFLAAEAKKRGLSNVHPVLVKAEGLDPFYIKNKFDLIYVSNSYHAIDDPIAYFSRLRKQLNPGGDLVIVMTDWDVSFDPKEFWNWHGLITALRGAPDNDPVISHLSKNLRVLLKKNKSNGDDVKNAVIADFNSILDDKFFYKSFISKSQFTLELHPVEHDFLDWLLGELRENGAFSSVSPKESTRTLMTIRKVNRLIMANLFQKFLVKDFHSIVVDPISMTTKDSIIRELQIAGYKLAKDSRLTSYYSTLTFNP